MTYWSAVTDFIYSQLHSNDCAQKLRSSEKIHRDINASCKKCKELTWEKCMGRHYLLDFSYLFILLVTTLVQAFIITGWNYYNSLFHDSISLWSLLSTTTHHIASRVICPARKYVHLFIACRINPLRWHICLSWSSMDHTALKRSHMCSLLCVLFVLSEKQLLFTGGELCHLSRARSPTFPLDCYLWCHYWYVCPHHWSVSFMRAKAGSRLFQGRYYLLALTFNSHKILPLQSIHGFRHI